MSGNHSLMGLAKSAKPTKRDGEVDPARIVMIEDLHTITFYYCEHLSVRLICVRFLVSDY